MGAPEVEPLPPEGEGPERERRLRRVWGFVQAGAGVFLIVVMLGLLPSILSASSPALGRRATIAVLILAPAVSIGLLVVAARRLRR